MKRLKAVVIFTIIFILLVLPISTVLATDIDKSDYNPDNLETNSPSVLLMDANTGKILYSKNAFERYNEIFESVKKYGKNKTIILALGPTATILAYDLSKLEGYTAVDLGHIDIEYEWFLRGVKKRKAIPGKFVNEVRTKDLSNEKNNNEAYDLYQNTIIKEIL